MRFALRPVRQNNTLAMPHTAAKDHVNWKRMAAVLAHFTTSMLAVPKQRVWTQGVRVPVTTKMRSRNWKRSVRGLGLCKTYSERKKKLPWDPIDGHYLDHILRTSLCTPTRCVMTRKRNTSIRLLSRGTFQKRYRGPSLSGLKKRTTQENKENLQEKLKHKSYTWMNLEIDIKALLLRLPYTRQKTWTSSF